ncbi:twin arginine-targeting protein translocase TatB [Acinetobacter marinus]|uniref:Sec-independent protein translocase protein TatB n=1 Tax=Acinetobacter marinus TaxID=281375 RepID=A0A1G6HSH1_9GAMM|nr:Sec-independent protein translocase protein TatB [Acinetobacter marinus]SDB97172.1 twin arginine-targeting protein translocase TatB [Acinetobacter marinus]
MFNLGISELLLFAVVALIVLGPDKLPEAARFAGRWYGKLKRMVNSVQNDIDRELRMSELKAQMQQELQRIKDLEAKMQAQYEQAKHQKLMPFKSPVVGNGELINAEIVELSQSVEKPIDSKTIAEFPFQYCDDYVLNIPFQSQFLRLGKCHRIEYRHAV